MCFSPASLRAGAKGDFSPAEPKTPGMDSGARYRHPSGALHDDNLREMIARRRQA